MALYAVDEQTTHIVEAASPEAAAVLVRDGCTWTQKLQGATRDFFVHERWVFDLATDECVLVESR